MDLVVGNEASSNISGNQTFPAIEGCPFLTVKDSQATLLLAVRRDVPAAEPFLSKLVDEDMIYVVACQSICLRVALGLPFLVIEIDVPDPRSIRREPQDVAIACDV